MPIRRLAVIAVCLLLISAGWAKGKLTPQRLMAKSDAVYFFPSAHGVTDLAVDLEIDQLASDPIGKEVAISYYYAGNSHERVAVTHLPQAMAQYSNSLLDLTSPVGQFIMPRPAAESFAGMTVQMQRVTRRILGVQEKTLYELVGTPTEGKDGVKEYRILLGESGVFYQIENALPDGTQIVANVESEKTDAGWHISTITTRLLTKDGIRWKIEHLDYEMASGYPLPVKYTTQYRNELNRPIKGVGDVTITFRNYRINTGAAATALAALEAAEQTAPASDTKTDKTEN